MATTRKPFNPSVDPEAIDDAPSGKVLHGACFAAGCPMPGSMSSGGNSWSCAWHYAAQPSTIPRITQVLRDWECLTYEINAGRRALTGKHCADPKVLHDLYIEAQERVKVATAAGGWADAFDGAGMDYRTWLYKLDMFLGQRVALTLAGK